MHVFTEEAKNNELKRAHTPPVQVIHTYTCNTLYA